MVDLVLLSIERLERVMRHLTFGEIVDLHGSILESGEPVGVDNGRVESILGCIQGGVGDELYHPTVTEAAAAYLFYFARNQSFDQGNKRTGVIACDIFLELNGSPLQSEIDPDFVVAVATGTRDKPAVVAYLSHLIAYVESAP
jgi:death on curing protein